MAPVGAGNFVGVGDGVFRRDRCSPLDSATAGGGVELLVAAFFSLTFEEGEGEEEEEESTLLAGLLTIDDDVSVHASPFSSSPFDDSGDPSIEAGRAGGGLPGGGGGGGGVDEEEEDCGGLLGLNELGLVDDAFPLFPLPLLVTDTTDAAATAAAAAALAAVAAAAAFSAGDGDKRSERSPPSSKKTGIEAAVDSGILTSISDRSSAHPRIQTRSCHKSTSSERGGKSRMAGDNASSASSASSSVK